MQPEPAAGCVVPPPQAPGKFYPYWTQAKVHGTCVWEFGQMTNGNTFGGDKQYGTFTTALGLAELASKIMPNRTAEFLEPWSDNCFACRIAVDRGSALATEPSPAVNA